jgi:Ca2+-binding EF-hand superfamily protein
MRLSTFAGPAAISLLSMASLLHPEVRGADRLDLTRRLGELLDRSLSGGPEWLEMAAAILKGEALDGEKGWWRPGQKLLGWEWLRARFDLDSSGRIEPGELPESELCFERLDRNRDGVISAEDFRAPDPGLSEGLGGSLFRRLDLDQNGRITPEELTEFFQRADRGGLGYLSREDLALALEEPWPSGARGAGAGGGMPSPWLMLGMLFSGQLGSLREGPALGAPAPDFSLETEEGKRYRLSDSRGKRPVVLIFGSFT